MVNKQVAIIQVKKSLEEMANTLLLPPAEFFLLTLSRRELCTYMRAPIPFTYVDLRRGTHTAGCRLRRAPAKALSFLESTIAPMTCIAGAPGKTGAPRARDFQLLGWSPGLAFWVGSAGV